MLTSPLCGNHSLAGRGKQKKIKQQSVQLHSFFHVVLQFSMEWQCKEKADMWVKFHACQGRIPTYHQTTLAEIRVPSRRSHGRWRWAGAAGIDIDEAEEQEDLGKKLKMGRVTEGWMKRNQDGKQKNHCLDLGRRGGEPEIQLKTHLVSQNEHWHRFSCLFRPSSVPKPHPEKYASYTV